jgi:hypothetical protein
MVERQKLGGIAALVAAATFIFGFALFATALADYTTGDQDPTQSVAFVVANQTTLYVWHLVILIAFSIVLVPLVLALHARLLAGAPTLTPMATAFGLIWAGLVVAAGLIANVGLGTVASLHAADPAGAEPVWAALGAVQNGLGGGNEIAGGLWVLLVSLAALRTEALPRALTYLGIVAGTAGLVTIVPAFEAVGAVISLGLIVWFFGVGVVLLRCDPSRAPDPAVSLEPSRSRPA